MSDPSKWDKRFLELAKHISTWSRDPSTQVGAVIVDYMNRLVSVGYNGFPRGVHDHEERYANRELKYKMTLHAEKNAILFARRSLGNCTLYTFPFQPCASCAGAVIQSGIQKVVSLKSNTQRWEYDFNIAAEMFVEAGVELELWDKECNEMKNDKSVEEFLALVEKIYQHQRSRHAT